MRRVVLTAVAAASLLATPLAADGRVQRIVSPTTASVGNAQDTMPPVIQPTPHVVRWRSGRLAITSRLTIVAQSGANRSSLAAVTRALEGSGANSIRIVTAPPAHPLRGLTVYIGRWTLVERELGTASAAGLAPGGYVLAAGGVPAGRSAIVLDGVDAAGEFYATQTLRQLLAGRTSLRHVVIRDWPALRVRGLVEGFYGPPWSLAQRLSMLDFLGRHKLNAYVYAPKDDPYERSRWRESYPRHALLEMAALVDRAIANHVEFTFAISPGLSICYSSDADEKVLLRKLAAVWSAGVRSFEIALDDLDAGRVLCAEDQARFGAGPAGLGAAQADLLNRVQRDFIDLHRGAGTLIAVPTEYSGIDSSPYKRAFASALSQRVVVQWTGRYGIAVAISDADASKARAIFRQPLLIWDNYYVNDQSRGFLALGPLTRHDPGLERFVVGDTADPLVQPEAAKIGLFTLADWSWNPAAYGPTRSWEASLDEFAGRDPRTVAALRVFADANYGSGLNPVQAPSLSTAISTFWSGWKAGDPAAVTRLKSVLIRVGAAPGLLRRRLAAPEFLQETAPWLDATQAWSKAATISVDLLVARRNGLDTRAKADDAAISQLVAVARSSLSLGTPVQVAAGVLDKFVAAARADRG